jgi:cytochrome c peroxidase
MSYLFLKPAPTCTSTLSRTVVTLAAYLFMGSAHAAPGDPATAPATAATLSASGPSEAELNRQLEITLRKAGFTGKVESTLEKRLGRKLNPALAEVGRNLFFDPIGALSNDNSCAGCHAPANGMGDSQSIAIGVLNNNLVGPDRKGPRNQRRTPTVINTAFYPSLMWNGRFSAPSGNPFDNSRGFSFPLPEGTTKFPPNDPKVTHLLIAQAHIPPTELSEAAGFKNTKGEIDPRLDKFDTGKGSPVPKPDASGFRNAPIRKKVMERLNASDEYVKMFGKIFPEVKHGSPITEVMFAQAIAEFEFSLVRADAPIDKFARGNHDAMIPLGKQGALLFFGKANCVACHAVAGQSNEMFSDFKNHGAGVPQIAPKLGTANVIYDGPGEDEDFGLEQFTGNRADRYKFRTTPLRNVGLQPTFFHNGAFTELEDAIRFHINTPAVARKYNAKEAGVDKDLTHRQGPMEPVLQQLDSRLSQPVRLTDEEIKALTRFVRVSLTDQGAKAEELCKLVPKKLPSGMKPLEFQGCN